jgi:hypothetical protein
VHSLFVFGSGQIGGDVESLRRTTDRLEAKLQNSRQTNKFFPGILLEFPIKLLYFH